MGFRLDVSCQNECYYGTKLFGYVDETKLLSWKFLKTIGALDELIKENQISASRPEHICWEGFFTEPISLSSEEFSEFIELYAKDLRITYDDDYADTFLSEIHPILMLSGDKLISWG